MDVEMTANTEKTVHKVKQEKLLSCLISTLS